MKQEVDSKDRGRGRGREKIPSSESIHCSFLVGGPKSTFFHAHLSGPSAILSCICLFIHRLHQRGTPVESFSHQQQSREESSKRLLRNRQGQQKQGKKLRRQGSPRRREYDRRTDRRVEMSRRQQEESRWRARQRKATVKAVKVTRDAELKYLKAAAVGRKRNKSKRDISQDQLPN